MELAIVEESPPEVDKREDVFSAVDITVWLELGVRDTSLEALGTVLEEVVLGESLRLD